MGSLACSGIARITRDAEIRKTGTGCWFSFGIAAFRKNTKEGKQDVDFFDVDLYQKEYTPGAERKFSKGTLMYIENAYLRNDQFKGNDGKEKSKVKLLINAFEFLNKPTEQKSEEAPIKKELPVYMKPLNTASTHPSDLPPPMVYNKPDLDPAGKKYFEDLKKKDSIGQAKAADGLAKDTMVEPEFEEEYQDEVPF